MIDVCGPEQEVDFLWKGQRLNTVLDDFVVALENLQHGGCMNIRSD